MNIWKREFTLDDLNQACHDCAVHHLGIEFSAKGDDWLEATMPINEKTMQPVGILHGGISAALAETVGSAAGHCCTEGTQAVVGAEINASHLRPVYKGSVVTARATAVKIGRTLHIWHIDIRNEENKLCCVSRLTLSVINTNE
ncbi:hotdog fold thioesterase [Lonepinella sp. MS14437]|uniref:hotdog fold thioesterase n=1 Tax=Lonepinella sp. MS14437 TaxID=3003620 RepID=UPI0036D971C8